MTSQQPQDVSAYNEDSLRTLSRAIALSKGRFSLILARCNYIELRDQIRQRLRETCPVEIEELFLQGSAKTLYTFIKTELGKQQPQTWLDQGQPQALMILGLESVADLDALMAATNQVRDEFRKSFNFPLVLWVTDEILRKLGRLAPDFSSWAGVPTRFAIATENLIHLLRQQTDVLINRATNVGAGRFPRSSALYLETDSYSRPELKVALKDLQQRQQELDPFLEANLQFISGLDAYAKGEMEQALQYYQQSLAFWQHQTDATDIQKPPIIDSFSEQAVDPSHTTSTDSHPPSTVNSLYVERRGCVLFYLGLWWRRYAVLHREEYTSACQQARDYYRQCIEGLRQGGCDELAAKFIIALGEVLQRLEEWGELARLARTAVQLHKTYFDPIRLAYSYGLLAEVALRRCAWEDAKHYAEQALETNKQPLGSSQRQQPSYLELSWARRHYRSLYLLLLAQSQQHLDLPQEAIANLKIAQERCNHAYDPLLYTRILGALRSLYYQQGEYLQAFETKQEQRSIEQQYSLRAFIGAVLLKAERQVINPALVPVEPPNHDSSIPDPEIKPLQQAIAVAQEIAASGRQQDVERLVHRLSRNDYKLTVIHGQSGVGKSSIINAGLVPALQQDPIGDRNVLPVVLNVYTDWVRELDNRLTSALRKRGLHSGRTGIPKGPDASSLIQQLHNITEHHNLLMVLIFDQFEEFFFICPDPVKRRTFFNFLGRCLNLPFVKLVLSLREDYLHYLLECDRLQLDSITDDILGRDKRYPLGNFSTADAKLIIQRLTQRSQFYMEPVLIDQLVKDLAQELGEVRPIELQVVGAQLQEDNITTLHQYQALGENPKAKLVGRFLEQVLEDCGPPNSQAANLVLYLLTDEKGMRPLKTLTELTTNLSKVDLSVNSEQLELILKILVKSGIVLLLPEVPVERYQLVHDYLVAFIRQRQQPDLLERFEKLQKQAELDRAKALQEERWKQLAFVGVGIVSALAIAAVGFAFLAYDQLKRAAISEVQATTSQSSALSSLNDQLGALVAGIKAGRQLQGVSAPLPVEITTLGQMQQAIYSVQELNRLVGHESWVNQVSFSPDGNLIASASADNTVRLWNSDGRLLRQPLRGHLNRVNSVDFSPDGKVIASASDDGTVKLWNLDGEELRTLDRRVSLRTNEPTSPVTSVSFSPTDGEIIASANDDGNVDLWSRQGELLQTLKGHKDRVRTVAFSPSGKIIASGSWDHTVRLWNRDGTPFGRPLDHGDKVTTVSFSPDGKTIASGGMNNVVKLWSLDGQLIQTFSGQTDRITSVSFSQDGKTLASASADGTVKLWKLNKSNSPTFGESQTLNIAKVISIRFGPDGRLASSDGDNTIRLWKLQGIEPKILRSGITKGSVTGVSFSPDGKMIASAASGSSRDGQATNGRLIFWNVNGGESRRFVVNGRVSDISFSPKGGVVAGAQNFPSKIDSAGSTLTPPGRVTLWSPKEGELRSFRTPGEITDVSFNPDGTVIAAAVNSLKATAKGPKQTIGEVILWDTDGREIRAFQAHHDAITSVSFSRDRKTIATGSADHTVKLWNLNGENLATLVGHSNRVTSVSFSPDGQTIASASDDTTVKIWSLDGTLLKTLVGHISSVTSVGFRADGKLIVSASSDGVIKLWNSEDGSLLATLQRNDSASTISGVSFSPDPDGRLLASASADDRITLWDFNLDHLLNQGCMWLQDYLTNNPTVSDSDRKICDNPVDR